MSHVATAPIKVKITRAWTDLAPKLLAFLTGGTAGSFVVYALDRYFGVTLDPGLASVIVVVAATILGYFVKDKAIIDAGSVSPGSAAVITALGTIPNAEVYPGETGVLYDIGDADDEKRTDADGARY